MALEKNFPNFPHLLQTDFIDAMTVFRFYSACQIFIYFSLVLLRIFLLCVRLCWLLLAASIGCMISCECYEQTQYRFNRNSMAGTERQWKLLLHRSQ